MKEMPTGWLSPSGELQCKKRMVKGNKRTILRRGNMLILKILGITGLSILGLILLAFAVFGIYMFWQLKDGIF